VPNTQRERVYQLRVKGHLDPRWTDGLDGLVITLEDNGDALLTGPVADQAALYGLLKKLRDLGLPLLAVNHLPEGRKTPGSQSIPFVPQNNTL
jgi:hypothetical protein